MLPGASRFFFSNRHCIQTFPQHIGNLHQNVHSMSNSSCDWVKASPTLTHKYELPLIISITNHSAHRTQYVRITVIQAMVEIQRMKLHSASNSHAALIIYSNNYPEKAAWQEVHLHPYSQGHLAAVGKDEDTLYTMYTSTMGTETFHKHEHLTGKLLEMSC